MENLLVLLNKISQISPLGVFNQEVIIVQNAGMQHWLNLAIADERGISMNMRYALPAQYLWQLIRGLASSEKVPEQSPYSRNVLTWRIYQLLADEKVIKDDDFKAATHYWFTGCNETNNDLINTKEITRKASLKRYQLAEQMADLYEQYLIFRPDWLDAWEKENNIDSMPIEQLSSENKWQAKLWLLLIEQLPYNPVELLNDAIANITDKLALDPKLLPKRLSFFGINTMAPMWLNFINALSEHIDVNFFHLNPCFSYWGDIISEKQALKQLSHWSTEVDNEHLLVGNPLLANFGQQGREFLALLQDYSTVNVELFVKASNEQSNNNQKHAHKHEYSILHSLQNDILALEDARDNTTHQLEPLIDDSITIVSCHSALREVQALHDFLLHQFNDNKTPLTPKDVLVMCPQIEQYAPYVNAVFAKGWQDLNDEVPPLPCSIADRSAKDSDPLIAAFSELLTLPDSRFQVSQLLGFIRLPAIANKFSMNTEDCEKISLWLEQACVHWGLDQTHKEKILGEKASNSFTWQQGLSRLLRGFSFSDSNEIHQSQLLLATIEGDDAIILGQLLLLVEQLQTFAFELNKPRSPKAWQNYLLTQVEQFFAKGTVFTTNNVFSSTHTEKNASHNQQIINSQIESSLSTIEQAIASLVEHCQHAHFDEEIELPIVVDYLNSQFSQADASRQFMIGQVTFCSMLPMRSIPFKIIAVLGLNDGEFPRQRQPLGFDLMSLSQPRLGDRSRRGDDRYLFLEALISARDHLYLSYQGRNIKNNTEKQPSLVLKELMDYLAQGYGWQFSGQANQVKQMPMQPYSNKNYLSILQDTSSTIKASFDANWLKLGQNDETKTSDTAFIIDDALTVNASKKVCLSATELIRFFQHPSKVFAQQQLNLYLTDNRVSLNDIEPFSAEHLEAYLLKQDLLAANLQSDCALTVEQVLNVANLSGKFPDLPSTQAHFDDALSASEQLSQEITDQGCANPKIIDCTILLVLNAQSGEQVKITAQLPVKTSHTQTQLVFYRSSTAKPKDLFTLYLHQLIVQLWQQQNITTAHYEENILSQVQSTTGFYFNTKSQKVDQYVLSHIENSQQALLNLLSTHQQGHKQALLLNGDLAALVYEQDRKKQPIKMTQARLETFWQDRFSDEYIQYFWQQCPEVNMVVPAIEHLYTVLYQVIEKVKAAKKTDKKVKGASN